jgi:predicted pyridoxine 5'-phosphate oxidase superfamily flavin-nucleotide-binding protein
MDYSNQRRLKLFGRAELRDAQADPELAASLAVPDYRASVERSFLIHIEAFDWNCPQHITPRFTADEVRAATAPLLAELAELKQRLARQDGAEPQILKSSASDSLHR